MTRSLKSLTPPDALALMRRCLFPRGGALPTPRSLRAFQMRIRVASRMTFVSTRITRDAIQLLNG